MNLPTLVFGPNWKTTSAGLTMIAGSVIHLAFQLKNKTADEGAWTLAVTGVLGGLGLIGARDASAAKQQVADIQSRLDQHDAILKTDTTQVKKTDTTNPT